MILFMFVIATNFNIPCKAVNYQELDDYAAMFGRSVSGHTISEMTQYKGNKLATTTDGKVIGTFKAKASCDRVFKRLKGR